MAASQIMAGCYDTVIAGGVEQITMLSGKQNMDGFVNEKLAESHPGIYHPMGITAECVANRSWLGLERRKLRRVLQPHPPLQCGWWEISRLMAGYGIDSQNGFCHNRSQL